MSDDTLLVSTHDGRSMPAFVARPASGSGPGLLVLQEIFGITDYVRRRASDLAELGYVTLVPELYWRLGPHIATDETTPAGLQEAFGYFGKLDMAQAADDAVAALEHMRGMPETGGKAGVLGFCLGGRLAYEVGVRSTPDVVVSYYGAGIADRLEDAGRLACPVIFHFGGADPYLPPEQAHRIQQVFASRPDTEVHMHPGANHAFDNFNSPMFYTPAASEAAWPQTTAFLDRNFPVRVQIT
ncbi:MAG: dienelactone hydrolase family protein [Chloroflexota bacterium]